MFFDGGSILAYVIGLLLTFAICRIFIKPIKWIFKLVINGILGGLILAAVNFVGGFAGITVVITPLSALIAGLLGVPGVLLVILLQYIL
ncbi:MAG: pro-sigmaK processing inhibitor BofA family protein [Clostridia bacterium]|nr:pro-sigmaK processing inhibitor BofA family protein [Clostridia bacterium]